LRDDVALREAVEIWKAAAPAPPRALELRIAAALQEAGAPVDPGAIDTSRSRWLRTVGATTTRRWLAVTAAALVGALALWQLWPSPELSPVEQALREAERTREHYARAIAELERQAGPLLARAGDPQLDGERAALLLRYRDRLVYLDSVLDEVRGFLDEHPGHAGAHSVLLAAYQEKQQLLVEVLALDRGGKT